MRLQSPVASAMVLKPVDKPAARSALASLCSAPGREPMPELTVVEAVAPSPLTRLVEDYLAACRARGLSPNTVNNSYGYPLRQILLPFAARQGIAEVSGL